MMSLLNKFIMINLSFKNFLKYYLLITLIMPESSSWSEISSANQKQYRAVGKITDIKVSQLSIPSLGSIGVKTKINDVMGLDIWQEITAPEIVKQLNYIPDVVSSKTLQSLLIDLYLSSSNPPQGDSLDIIKFLETRLVKIKRKGS